MIFEDIGAKEVIIIFIMQERIITADYILNVVKTLPVMLDLPRVDFGEQ